MVSPGDISGAIGSVVDNGVIGLLVKYSIYTLIAVIIIGGVWVFYLLSQFKYKVTYPVIHHNDSKCVIIGYKWDRARTIEHDGIKKQQFLLSRKKTEPFKEEHIHPKNTVNLLKINDDGTLIYMPRLILEGGVSKFESITPEEKFWGVLQLKENAATYRDDDAQKRVMWMTIGTAVVCLIVVCITVWLSTRSATNAISEIRSLVPSIDGLAKSIAGTPPG